MKTYMQWHGGSNYAVPGPDDTEEFDTLERALGAFRYRTNSLATHYPLVTTDVPDDGGPTAWLFFADPRESVGDAYPDRVAEFGPRGGLRVNPA